MNNKPLVSVIMPAYNSQKYIERAIESILDQTFRSFEFIIINDASDDRTMEIIEKFAKKDARIKVFSNKKNLQIAASLNLGMKLAQTEFIARMDPDDISHERRLEYQYNFLRGHEKVAIVGSDIVVLNEKGHKIAVRQYPSRSDELKKVMFKYSPFAHPVIMFRKKYIIEFGGYDIKMVPCEDIDLWFKVGSKYEFASLKKFLLQYTLLITSNSHKSLRDLELLGFRIKINAIRKFGYRPNIYDIVYNSLQFLTLWIMPRKFRIVLYNKIRSKKLI